MVKSDEAERTWFLESSKRHELGVCVFPAVCTLQPLQSCCLSYNNKVQFLQGPFGSGQRGAPWLEIRGEKGWAWCLFPSLRPHEISCTLHLKVTIPSLKALLWKFCPSVCTGPSSCSKGSRLNDGVIDINLRLLLHTHSAFVTCPFLNKRTSPWIASIWVCHVISIGTLANFKSNLCYPVSLGPWPSTIISRGLSIFIEQQGQGLKLRCQGQGKCLEWVKWIWALPEASSCSHARFSWFIKRTQKFSSVKSLHCTILATKYYKRLILKCWADWNLG